MKREIHSNKSSLKKKKLQIKLNGTNSVLDTSVPLVTIVEKFQTLQVKSSKFYFDGVSILYREIIKDEG